MRIRKPLQVLLQTKMLKEKWKRAWAWINQVEDYTPEVFVKSQWQFGETSTLYLLYRWMLAGIFVCGLLASMFNIGRDALTLTCHLKWLIYLTNWGYTLCTTQAIMSTMHVTKHYAKTRQNTDTGTVMKMKTSYKIYWVMHSIALISAIGITSIYWTAIYNPEISRIDAVNLVVHLFNSLLMIIDFFIVAHPVKLFHCYWTFAFAICYLIFNFCYFLAGGTDRLGRVYIYSILDWRRPKHAIIAAVCCLIYITLITVIVWMLCIVRRRLANCIHRRYGARSNLTQDSGGGPRIV